MKKIIFVFLISTVLSLSAMAAGRIAEIWTQPAVFKADESVSWFFDVTGTDLEGLTEGVYMWTWFPTEPDAGHWSNSSEFAALTYVEGNLWRFDLTPTDYYGVEASTITAFYGLLKNKDGSKATDAFAPDQIPANDIRLYSLSTIKGTALIDYYPKDFTVDRPLSVLINANNTWSGCETSPIQGDLANAANVHMHGGVNFWNILVENNADNLEKTELTALGNGIYRMDMILEDYFSLPSGYELNNINMVFSDATWTHIGKDQSCNDFLINTLEEPVSELKFFPQKFSRKDLLTIIRTDNESYVSALTYTITAGTVVLTGSFEGKSDEMRAYIDLVTPLKDQTTIDKINVVIKDNTGRTITNTDISLVTL
ncbi:MAG: hypothetical protein JW973_08390 [Bacteroidales bacterium]|nr:hypothetical protein [Bacteroidales bacterium]